jgi:purine-nucleoside phosphorylase
MEELKKAYNYVYNIIKRKVSYGLILGSGLGGVTDSFENKIEISYNEIPEFPVSTVPGHDGRLVFGEYNGKFAVLMKGRFHFYEGYEPSRVVYGVRLMKLLGVEKLIITNAAGGVNTEFNPGDLMIITDHIGLFAPSPLRGPNFSEFGPRFPDMSYAYNPELIRIAEACAKKLNIPVRKGVYVFTQGPMFETPAEIRAIRILGGDAVGMSTVLEVITANHCGIKVLGISCISNMAAGVLDQPLSHEEVMETGDRIKPLFISFVKEILDRI